MTGGTQDPDGREGASGISVLSLEQQRDRSGGCQFPTQVWKVGQRRARTPHGGAERPPAAPASRPCARAARLGGCRYLKASAHVSTPQPCAAEGGGAVGRCRAEDCAPPRGFSVPHRSPVWSTKAHETAAVSAPLQPLPVAYPSVAVPPAPPRSPPALAEENPSTQAR